jgi:hypothetical protein
MAPQTKTQRQAAAQKAAATRKRNTAAQTSGRAKASARRTAGSAETTGRAARTTAKQAGEATSQRGAAEATRLQAAARRAQRAVYVPVGALLEARDSVAGTVRTYTDPRRARRQFDRFERRGERALRRNRGVVKRQVTEARRGVEIRANDVQTGTEDLVERVRSLV